MSRGSDLAKNTTILLVGRISTRAISFFLLPLYTAYLSKTEYGVVDLVQTLITLLCPIIGLQMEQALFRYMIPERNNLCKTRELVSSALGFCFMTLIGYIVICLCLSPFVHNEYKWYLLTNVVVAIILSFSQQISRGLGKNADYAVTSFIASIAVILLNIWFIVGLGWGAYGMLSATFLGNGVGVVYSMCRTKIWHYISLSSYSNHIVKTLLHYSAPLVPNELSWWAIRASDRIVITAFIGLSANGLISIGHRFPEIFMTLYSVFGLAWTESIVLHFKESDGAEYFSTMTVRMVKFFSSICLIVISFTPFVFHVMINEKFDGAYSLIPLYFIGTIINVAIGLISVIYIVHNETKKIAGTAVVAAIIAVVSNIGLVNIIGIYASPISFILGYGVMLIYRCVDMRRLAKIDWDKRFLISLVICTTIIVALYLSKILIFQMSGVCIALSFFWVYNNSSLNAIQRVIKVRFRVSKT